MAGELRDMFGGDHDAIMRYMTQAPRAAGPDARRAEALMPAGPRSADDPVELQEQPLGRLVALFHELTRPRWHVDVKGLR